MKSIYVAKVVAATLRHVALADDEEHGGALVGDPFSKDIFALVLAPRSTRRSSVHIDFVGRDLEPGVARAVRHHPGSAFLGWSHTHKRLATLSAGDHATLGRLVGQPPFDKTGILAVLAYTRAGAEPGLRAWHVPVPDVCEELEVREVDDPVRVRAESRQSPVGERVDSRPGEHCLASDEGRARFESELDALSKAGFSPTAEVSDRGVEVRLTDDSRRGTLVITIPMEGWARPPRVEVRGARPGGPQSIVTSLAPFFSCWNSSYALFEVVDYVASRNVWPRHLHAVVLGMTERAAS